MRSVPAEPVTTLEEWPTWLFIGFVYAAYSAILFNFHAFPWYVSFPILTVILTLHSSMCHELIHGHPTRNQTINNLIGYPPITLIYPYTIFRETHIKHHENEFITYPGIDPESFFITPSNWKKKSRFGKLFARAQMTLLGRLLFGPGQSAVRMAESAVQSFRQGSWRRRVMWICHYGMTAAVVCLAYAIFNIHPVTYILAAYFSLSLIQVRSFYEHRPAESHHHRSVIQEASWLMSLIYLNNNYHYVHHRHPWMPWYRLRKEYLDHKETYIRENGNFLYPGYTSWFKHLFKPVNSPIHPFYDS